MSIKMDSDYTLRSYGCFVELFLIFYPLLLGFLQIIHLIYRYQLYLYTYHSTPYLNHIDNGDFELIYISGGLACFLSLLLAGCSFFEKKHTEFTSKLSEISGTRFAATYFIVAIILFLVNFVPLLLLNHMRQEKILVSYGEYISRLQIISPRNSQDVLKNASLQTKSKLKESLP